MGTGWSSHTGRTLYTLLDELDEVTEGEPIGETVPAG